jgi:hypothetical protein
MTCDPIRAHPGAKMLKMGFILGLFGIWCITAVTRTKNRSQRQNKEVDQKKG